MSTDDIVPTQDLSIDGPHGGIPLRIYTPCRAAGVLVHFHGGGWVLGSIDGDEAYCQAIARRARCTVVSVDYRLALENRLQCRIRGFHG
ncbi:alpha/beta hydrolase fold domain-containing protein [Rhizobium leguminosarum]